MFVYRYHQDTGEYLGQASARIDPAEAALGHTRYLVPASATTIEPPETGGNQAAVWNGTAWEIVADYRGQTAYQKNDASAVKITKLGDIPEDLTLLEPCDCPTWDNSNGGWVEDTAAKKQARIAEIKAELAALDVAAIRPLRAIAAGSATENDMAKISELETQAQALRASLTELE